MVASHSGHEPRDGGMEVSEERDGVARSPEPQARTFVLMLVVVALGVSYGIAGNIRAKVLGQYSGIVTIFLNSVAYAVVYFPVLWWRQFRGIVPKAQVTWTYTWQHRGSGSSGGFWSRAGAWKYMFLGGLLDCLSQVLQFIAQAYVSIFSQVIFHQVSTVYTSLWSMALLNARYILVEIVGLCLSSFGGLVTLLNAGRGPGQDPPVYLVLQALAGIPPAFVLKELMFRRWEQRQGHGRETLMARPADAALGAQRLDVWCVNSAAALFQLSWALPVGLLVAALKKPEGETISGFLTKASDCFFNDPGSGCHGAWQTYAVYIILDILFNIGVYTLVREGSALLTFLTLQVMTPLTALVALLPWPVVGAATLSPADIASLVVVSVGAVLFRHGNVAKEKLDGGSRSLCCFPLCGRRGCRAAS